MLLPTLFLRFYGSIFLCWSYSYVHIPTFIVIIIQYPTSDLQTGSRKPVNLILTKFAMLLHYIHVVHGSQNSSSYLELYEAGKVEVFGQFFFSTANYKFIASWTLDSIAHLQCNKKVRWNPPHNL